jgi:hypothetical protein
VTSKRTVLARPRREPITPEMIELFRRGRELQAEGYDDVDAKGPEADEFKRINKRLCWVLLKRDLHMVSVFDPGLGEHFDAPMPGYMTKQPDDLYGWRSAQATALALQDALDAQDKPTVSGAACRA